MFGKITFYNPAKGFGFVTTDDGANFFYHISNFKAEEQNILAHAVGGYVVFNVGPGIKEGKKRQAIAVRFASREEIERNVSTQVGANMLAAGGAE